MKSAAASAKSLHAAVDLRVAELTRKLALARARQDVLEFGKLFMPDAQGIKNGDPLATRYKPKPIHRLLAAYLHRLEAGAEKRMALSVPPQFGKSQLASVFFIAWFVGRNPDQNVLFATYNEDLARTVGRKVKAIMESAIYREIFTDCALRADGKSSEELATTAGGSISFLGRGGSGTGKPCDLQVIDDPIKNRAEARSPGILTDLWDWYTSVMNTRCHEGTRRIIIHTRWTTDDLIGRICDPSHPDYDPKIAMDWSYVNIPAVVTDPALAAELELTLEVPTAPDVIDQFGTMPMASLWPREPGDGPKARSFSLDYLAKQRRLSPKVFEALYQGNPSPDDGAYFTRDMLVTYRHGELPSRLRYYGASDHALKETRDGDPALIGVIGVDDHDDWWILPDLAWDHYGPDGMVEQITAKILTHRPVYWFGENDLIGKTLGPSLRRRMEELNAYCTMIPVPVQGDKEAKAASAQARMSLRKVHFPGFAPWWPKAQHELLKFPNYTHDEMPDFLGILGRGLDSITRASRGPRPEEKPPEVMTMGWITRQSDLRKRRALAARNIV